MGKFKGILTVTDLDGTLIDSSRKVSKENIEAIQRYVDQGGLFTIATGRTTENVKPFLEGLPINCPSILYNGAAIYDIGKQEFIKCTYLDRGRLIKPLKELMAMYQNLNVQIFAPGTMYVVSEGHMDPVLDLEGQPYELASFEEVLKREWIKILLHDENAILKEVDQYLQKQFSNEVISTVFSFITYLELLPFGVTKGSALMELMELTGVGRDNVYAIGDYCNDIEMIEVAGTGAATRNAHVSLKAVADLTVVSNDENALRHLIEEVITERVG